MPSRQLPHAHVGPKVIYYGVLTTARVQGTNALSFLSSKIILDRPNHFDQFQIVLVGSISFWSGSK